MEQCESEFVQLSDGDEPITVEFATELTIDYVPESKSVEVQVTGEIICSCSPYKAMVIECNSLCIITLLSESWVHHLLIYYYLMYN